MRKVILLTLFLAGMAGCAIGLWSQAGGLFSSNRFNFSVDLPAGWMKSNTSSGLIITRDGVLLQQITITRLEIKKELPHTKKKFKKDMLPQEVAEVVIDDMITDSTFLNFEIIENTPAKIAEFYGFRLVSSFTNSDGLKYKSVEYGFINGEYFYDINYVAPQRYYFDKDINTFEEAFKSFRLIKII